MENFLNYISKPIPKDDVDIWFKINDIVFEKLILFSDFFKSLNNLIHETYLGYPKEDNESIVKMSNDDNDKHFKWCWKKIINNFNEDKIFFYFDGEHVEYFFSFYLENYYNQEDKMVRDMIGNYLNELFDVEKSFTKSDLEMLGNVYKILDKNLKK